MHSSALVNLKNFFSTYLKYYKNPKILDFGSQSKGKQKHAKTILKELKIDFQYTGVDIEKGDNVNLLLKDPYSFKEIIDEEYDIVICTSVFEHIEFFWLTYLEILRILKPRGIFYLNVPSNGDFHRWPKDNWRFYPDSGNALVNWAKRNSYNCLQLESFTADQYLECGWNDYICVTLKEKKYLEEFNDRIIYTHKDFSNGVDHNNKLYNFSNKSEDHKNWGYRFWYRFRKKIQRITKKT